MNQQADGKSMHKTVVIDIVGLSASVIGEYTPFLNNYISGKNLQRVIPMLPALTTSVQSTYLTGKWPSEHGIVGNGWYDKTDAEIKFWKQSNKLVKAEKIWERAKNRDPDFTVSKMFWWYNMYSTADYAVTPRPNYLADGRKIADCYSQPAGLRDELQRELGQFPLFKFWGPGANISSTKWIADASVYTDKKYNPDLTLIYLPHLDYSLQKYGPDLSKVAINLTEIDNIVRDLVEYYSSTKASIILLSEYGISKVDNPIHINRILRQNDLLAIRIERGHELLDAGASKAFAVADHQIAHVYVNDGKAHETVRNILSNIDGVEKVLSREEQAAFHLDHERSGDFVLMANQESWFTYYFWLDNAVAPDYARSVDIHKKPGYDPVELFMTSRARAGYKLLRKKVGLRYVMDVIPLDALLVKGSHGSIDVEEKYYPVIITDEPTGRTTLLATDVYNVIWEHLTL
jgi:predicted AlkP superfamily pyrophosphatase or phosphodiesterase